MIASSVQKIASLLGETGKAHHEYEQRVLQGVYDRDWAIWYAEYAIDRGLDKLLERSLTPARLGEFLGEINRQYEAENPPQSWAEYTASHLVDRGGNQATILNCSKVDGINCLVRLAFGRSRCRREPPTFQRP